ncbi:MAG: hypothetical protein H6597_05580 [Flavobacteriales bacterium]|nr:hypothetical protein [Flavobacteriales bacterium]MCB9193985.1 hypothetical protein [Flavobacteriales bacterium]
MRMWCNIGLCLALCSLGCRKDEVMSSTPEIALVDLSPTLVAAFGDPVHLKLSYKDGNGDLGTEDPDDRTLEIKDSRLSAPDTYHVQPLAPLDSEVPIQGELDVQLDPLFLIGNGDQESVTFSIRIRDREGNWSNTVVSPTVIIVDSL